MPRAQRPDKHRGPEVATTPRVVRNRAPTTADYRMPENNQYYELACSWVDSTNDDIWFLVDITANVATWINVTGEQLTLTGDDSEVISSDAAGNIDVHGKTVSNATRSKPLWVEGTLASTLIDLELQVGADRTGEPGDKLDAGVVSFDDTQFVVNEDGYVTLKGGIVLPVVQTITGDDTEAVGPDVNGNINWNGKVIANGTNAKPLYFNGTPGSSLMEPELQVTAAVTGAPGDKLDAGIVSFDDTQFTVDANGYVRSKGSVTRGSTNLGISYAAGVFTINGFDGTALSSDNSAYITFQSKATPGEQVKVEVTANQTFQDAAHGSSEIVNNTFGTSPGSAWTYDVPFFIYAVLNDSEDAVAFMISRFASHDVSPVLADIGAPDDAVADHFNSFWSLDSIDETLYDQNPALCVGSFKMTKDGSDDWTVKALSHRDGFNKFQTENFFYYDPVIIGDTTAGSGTYSEQTGTYSWVAAPYGVGLMVTFRITATNHTGDGIVTITTPFNFGTNITYFPVFITGATSSPAGTQEIVAESEANENYFRVRTIDFGTTQSYCSIDSTSSYFGSVFYRAQFSN